MTGPTGLASAPLTWRRGDAQILRFALLVNQSTAKHYACKLQQSVNDSCGTTLFSDIGATAFHISELHCRI